MSHRDRLIANVASFVAAVVVMFTCLQPSHSRGQLPTDRALIFGFVGAVSLFPMLLVGFYLLDHLNSRKEKSTTHKGRLGFALYQGLTFSFSLFLIFLTYWICSKNGLIMPAQGNPSSPACQVMYQVMNLTPWHFLSFIAVVLIFPFLELKNNHFRRSLF